MDLNKAIKSILELADFSEDDGSCELGERLCEIESVAKEMGRELETPMAKVKKFNNLVIKQIPRHGELAAELRGKTIGVLIADCGDLLDHQNIVTSEVVGRVVFKASNGKWYTVNVEAVIDEIDKKTAEDMIQEE